jgi:hypothetical protein
MSTDVYQLPPSVLGIGKLWRHTHPPGMSLDHASFGNLPTPPPPIFLLFETPLRSAFESPFFLFAVNTLLLANTLY